MAAPSYKQFVEKLTTTDSIVQVSPSCQDSGDWLELVSTFTSYYPVHCWYLNNLPVDSDQISIDEMILDSDRGYGMTTHYRVVADEGTYAIGLHLFAHGQSMWAVRSHEITEKVYRDICDFSKAVSLVIKKIIVFRYSHDEEEYGAIKNNVIFTIGNEA